MEMRNKITSEIWLSPFHIMEKNKQNVQRSQDGKQNRLREAFKKKKNKKWGNFPQGGGGVRAHSTLFCKKQTWS